MKTIFILLLSLTSLCLATEPIRRDSRRELFVDDHLIASMDGVVLKMYKPQAQEVALVCDARCPASRLTCTSCASIRSISFRESSASSWFRWLTFAISSEPVR